VVFLEAADSRGGEYETAVGQFRRIDVVKGPVGQSPGRTALGGNPIDVEEGIAVVGHRDVDRAAVEGNVR